MKGRFQGDAYRGDEVLSADVLVKCFGDREVLSGVGFMLYGKDRMVLLGPNGCGKTTLLRILLGEMVPESGTVHFSPSVKLGYLPQEVIFEAPERTVMDTLRYAYAMDEGRARNLLAMYRFTGNDVFKTVSALSGGEKSRLKLCLLMQEEVNLLVLDEPTNHLDLPAREWMESSLDDFPGAILFVSHDRYFIRRFANRIAEMEDGEVSTYLFDYTEWRAWKEWKKQQEVDTETIERDGESPSEAARLRREAKNRQRNLSAASRLCEQKERIIVQTEARLSRIEAEMMEQATDFLALQTLAKEKEALLADLPTMYDQWGKAQETLSEWSDA